jgi:hypothetical protein
MAGLLRISTGVRGDPSLQGGRSLTWNIQDGQELDSTCGGPSVGCAFFENATRASRFSVLPSVTP